MLVMERIFLTEHAGMDNSVESVQNTKKKRSQSDKIGRLKYNQQLLKQTLSEVEEVKVVLRTIFAGLKGSFSFEQSLIERVACEDEVDKEILQMLFEAGNPGLLPKDLAAKLAPYRITRHQISRRIFRMNKRLKKELGEDAAEKRGWHWALTGFVADNWRTTKEDLA